MTVKDTVGKNC